MAQLIHKLPFDLRSAWVKKSVAVEQNTGQIADFSCFVSSVVNSAEEANSLYGRRVFGTQPSRAHSEARSVNQRSADLRKATVSSYNVKVQSSKASSKNCGEKGSTSFECFECLRSYAVFRENS